MLNIAAASRSFTASLGVDSDTFRYSCLCGQVQLSDAGIYLHNRGCVESGFLLLSAEESGPGGRDSKAQE